MVKIFAIKANFVLKDVGTLPTECKFNWIKTATSACIILTNLLGSTSLIATHSLQTDEAFIDYLVFSIYKRLKFLLQSKIAHFFLEEGKGSTTPSPPSPPTPRNPSKEDIRNSVILTLMQTKVTEVSTLQFFSFHICGKSKFTSVLNLSLSSSRVL